VILSQEKLRSKVLNNITIRSKRYQPTPESNTSRQRKAHKSLVKRYLRQVEALHGFIISQQDLKPDYLKDIDSKLNSIENLASSLKIPFKDISLSHDLKLRARTLYDEMYKASGRIQYLKENSDEHKDDLDRIAQRLISLKKNLADLKNNDDIAAQNPFVPEFEPIQVTLHKEPSYVDKLKASCRSIRANAEMLDESLASRLGLISEISDSIFDHLDQIIGLKNKDDKYCITELVQSSNSLQQEQAKIDTSTEQGLKDLGMITVVLNNLEFLTEWFEDDLSKKRSSSVTNHISPPKVLVIDSFKDFLTFKAEFKNGLEKLLVSMKKTTQQTSLRGAVNKNHETVNSKLDSLYSLVLKTDDLSYKRYALKKTLEAYSDYSKFFEVDFNKLDSYHLDDYRYKLSQFSSFVARIASLAADSKLLDSSQVSEITKSLQASNPNPNSWKQNPLVAIDTALGKPFSDKNIATLQRSLAKFIFAFKTKQASNSDKAKQLSKVFEFLDRVIKRDIDSKSQKVQVTLEQAIVNISKALADGNNYETESKFSQYVLTELKSLAVMSLDQLESLFERILERKNRFGLNPKLESDIKGAIQKSLDKSKSLEQSLSSSKAKSKKASVPHVIDDAKKIIINKFLLALNDSTT
jgi:hypothetical protein